MSELFIRRVALAICKSRTCEGVSCCQWPSNGGRTQCNAKKGYYDEAARDAIAAMQDPSGAMMDAGNAAREASISAEVNTLATWLAMIEAALAVSAGVRETLSNPQSAMRDGGKL